MYPACVGLSKAGDYGKVSGVWTDNKRRSTRWYYSYIPFHWLKYDEHGVYLLKITLLQLSWLERSAHNALVLGSNPSGSTNHYLT